MNYNNVLALTAKSVNLGSAMAASNAISRTTFFTKTYDKFSNFVTFGTAKSVNYLSSKSNEIVKTILEFWS